MIPLAAALANALSHCAGAASPAAFALGVARGLGALLAPGAPERAASFERVFGTPTGTDLAALCAAHGVRHEVVTSRARLEAAVAQAPQGIRVVEVPVERASHRAAHADLRALAAEVLRG